jgi:GDP-D-mannose dehydratase
MLQQVKPDDFVIATGESNSLESFVEGTLACVELN